MISTCKNRRSSSHCFTGITLSLASFHSFATTTATLFAVTLARANSRSRVFLSSYIVSKQIMQQKMLLAMVNVMIE